eukprot:m51a1_g11899 putative protein serine threonine (503) ;mRNA; f:610012-611520
MSGRVPVPVALLALMLRFPPLAASQGPTPAPRAAPHGLPLAVHSVFVAAALAAGALAVSCAFLRRRKGKRGHQPSPSDVECAGLPQQQQQQQQQQAASAPEGITVCAAEELGFRVESPADLVLPAPGGGAPLDVNKVHEYARIRVALLDTAAAAAAVELAAVALGGARGNYLLTVEPAGAKLARGAAESAELTVRVEPLCTTVIDDARVYLVAGARAACVRVASTPSGPSVFIDPARITVAAGALLGAGATGSVIEGVYEGTHVAIKQILRTDGASALEEIQREISSLQAVRSPYVTSLHGVVRTINRKGFLDVSLVLELAPHGSLEGLYRHEGSSARLIRRVVVDAAKGIRAVHDAGFIHRDIKPSNILVFGLDERSEQAVAKLADFGTAKEVDDVQALLMHTKGVGTPIYTAPEVLSAQEYSSAIDVYSLSVTMWEVATRSPPFGDMKSSFSVVTHVLEGGRPDASKASVMFPPELLQRCWSQNPKLRPSIQEVIATLES